MKVDAEIVKVSAKAGAYCGTIEVQTLKNKNSTAHNACSYTDGSEA